MLLLVNFIITKYFTMPLYRVVVESKIVVVNTLYIDGSEGQIS